MFPLLSLQSNLAEASSPKTSVPVIPTSAGAIEANGHLSLLLWAPTALSPEASCEKATEPEFINCTLRFHKYNSFQTNSDSLLKELLKIKWVHQWIQTSATLKWKRLVFEACDYINRKVIYQQNHSVSCNIKFILGYFHQRWCIEQLMDK